MGAPVKRSATLVEIESDPAAFLAALREFEFVQNLSAKTHPSLFDMGAVLGVNGELVHGAIGLATEGPEILDHIKKAIFGRLSAIDHDHILEESGDLFWYLWLVLRSQGYSMIGMLNMNSEKLRTRYHLRAVEKKD